MHGPCKAGGSGTDTVANSREISRLEKLNGVNRHLRSPIFLANTLPALCPVSHMQSKNPSQPQNSDIRETLDGNIRKSD
jgi:hypothetical protein